MFIYFCETVRDIKSRQGRGRERRRHRIRSRLQAPHYQHTARCGAQTHEPWEHDLSWSRTLNQLSHPGVPIELFQGQKNWLASFNTDTHTHTHTHTHNFTQLGPLRFFSLADNARLLSLEYLGLTLRRVLGVTSEKSEMTRRIPRSRYLTRYLSQDKVQPTILPWTSYSFQFSEAEGFFAINFSASLALILSLFHVP